MASEDEEGELEVAEDEERRAELEKLAEEDNEGESAESAREQHRSALAELFGSEDEDEKEEEGEGDEDGDNVDAKTLATRTLNEEHDTRHRLGNEGSGEGAGRVSSTSQEGVRVRSKPWHLPVTDMPTPNRLGQTHLAYVKLPNILGIEPSPFDSSTHVEEDDLEEYVDEDGVRRIRLRTENVIRWRVNDQTKERESNARIVRWSDGSMQLFVGSEVLDIATQDAQSDNSFVFARQKGVVRCHGKLINKFGLRPATLSSKSHKKLKMAIAERHVKISKIKTVSTREDPELLKRRREAAEAERISAQQKLDEKRRQQMSQYSRELSAQMLEEGMEEEGEGGEEDGAGEEEDEEDEGEDREQDNLEGKIAAIKRRWKRGGSIAERARRQEELGSAEEEDRARRLLGAKAGDASANRRQENHEGDEGDDDDEVVPMGKRRKGRSMITEE